MPSRCWMSARDADPSTPSWGYRTSEVNPLETQHLLLEVVTPSTWTKKHEAEGRSDFLPPQTSGESEGTRLICYIWHVGINSGGKMKPTWLKLCGESRSFVFRYLICTFDLQTLWKRQKSIILKSDFDHRESWKRKCAMFTWSSWSIVAQWRSF